MRKAAAILIFFMAVSSLYAGNHDKLVGEWKFNVEKFKESDEYKEAVKDPQKGQMMQFMIGMMGKLSFKFTKTEAIAIKPGQQGPSEDKAEYTVVSDSGDKLEIKTKNPAGNEEVIILTFIDDKNIKMEPKAKQPGPMSAMYLIKK